MKIGTRLILLLTVMVSAVMAAASYITLRQHEANLVTAMRNEVRAHALTLQIALEEDYLTGRTIDAQRLINRLRENTALYGVLLFDAEGRVATLSDPLLPEEIRYLKEAHRVIATGETIEVARSINDQEVFSVIRPIHVGAQRLGAIEIAQPLSYVKAHIARARLYIIITALLLCLTIFLVVWAVTRYRISRPIQELLGGAAAFGRGELDHRVTVPRSGGEFAELGQEFNRMADQLAEQRRAVAREAEEKVGLGRKLRHSERLAAAGRLAAGVAHEMGAPLQVIDGRAKQLLNHPDAPLETRQRNLTIIRTQTERITRIVRQLLDLARPYNLRRQPVDLASLMAGTLELIDVNASRAGVEVELPRADQVLVEADPDLLHQVFLNICLNGLQAMPGGGRLRIECVTAGGEKDGQHFAAVRISDTGTGIAPEHLAHIFDPFYTTKEVGRGTGLGLTLASRIVEEHGGWIEAVNNAEGGATFTVYLPKAGRLQQSLAAEPMKEGVSECRHGY